MPRLPIRTAFRVSALLLALTAASWCAAERHYRMYRNPPKPRLALLPVETGCLEKHAKDQFDQALRKEAGRLDGFQIVDFPAEVALDPMGQLPPGALAVLRKQHRIDLVLQSKFDQVEHRNALYAEIIDTRNGDVRADFGRECDCPVGELIATMVPESVKRMTGAPRMKGLRCGRGMAAIPAPSAKDKPEGDSTGAAWGRGAFCMDLYEYPNQPSGEPQVEKSWEQAAAQCAKEGKRLCTEVEWELACGGFDTQTFPYGAGYLASQCNTQSHTIQLSGGNAGCRSPFGVYDLSGNVYEWTSSEWSAKYKDKVVKGGNWSSGAENSSCKARFGQPPGTLSKAIGFRCCLSLSR